MTRESATAQKTPAEVANLNARAAMSANSSRAYRREVLLDVQTQGFAIEPGTLSNFAEAEYARGFRDGQKDATDD